MIRLDTERLALRELEHRGAAFIEKLVNDPDWLRYIGDRNVHSPDDAKRYIDEGPRAAYAKHGFGLLMVERRADGEPLGICGLIKRDTLEHVDVGFAFLPAFRGAGYAREAASACIEHGRALGLTRIVAITTQDNEASGKLLERIGFRYEREYVEPKGETWRLFAIDL